MTDEPRIKIYTIDTPIGEIGPFLKAEQAEFVASCFKRIKELEGDNAILRLQLEAKRSTDGKLRNNPQSCLYVADDE